MPILSNNQVHADVLGNRLLFKLDDQGSTKYPFLDIGVISQPAGPSLATNQVEFRDPYKRNGIIGRGAGTVDETYTIQTINLSSVNFALYYLSTPPAALSVTGSAETDVAQPTDLIVGRSDGGGFLEVKDSSGNAVRQLASIQDVKHNGGATTLVKGSDWFEDDLDLGTIRLAPGGTSSLTEGQEIDDLTISYTSKTISGNRVIAPQTLTNIEGTAILTFRECPGLGWVRECRASLTPNNANFAVNAASNLEFTLTVLADSGSAACSDTFGKLTQYAGDVASNIAA
ncbi:MAG: hypothetical protein AAF663_00035 [Planctomycetota bacterium]